MQAHTQRSISQCCKCMPGHDAYRDTTKHLKSSKPCDAVLSRGVYSDLASRGVTVHMFVI